MSRRVFISFRYNDGHKYKDYLSNLFSKTDTVINCSESQDRSNMSEDTIKRYLYDKLKNTSVTIVLLTSDAVNHKKGYNGLDMNIMIGCTMKLNIHWMIVMETDVMV